MKLIYVDNDDKRMTRFLIALLIVFLAEFLIYVGTVQATQITYSDTSCLNVGSEFCSSKMFIYYPNGTLAGSLNGTSDSIDIDTSPGLNLYIKPSSVSLINNPTWALNWFISTWPMWFTLIVIFGMAIAGILVLSAAVSRVAGRTGFRGFGRRRGGGGGRRRWG